jgi:hypothetical protein
MQVKKNRFPFGNPSIRIDSACAIEPFDPVAVAKIFDPDPSTGARCMDELVVAKIDSDVGEMHFAWY